MARSFASSGVKPPVMDAFPPDILSHHRRRVDRVVEDDGDALIDVLAGDPVEDPRAFTVEFESDIGLVMELAAYPHPCVRQHISRQKRLLLQEYGRCRRHGRIPVPRFHHELLIALRDSPRPRL